MLLIHGARSALRAGKLTATNPMTCGAWARRPSNDARATTSQAVALANKLARVAWRVWRDQRPFERRLPA